MKAYGSVICGVLGCPISASSLSSTAVSGKQNTDALKSQLTGQRFFQERFAHWFLFFFSFMIDCHLVWWTSAEVQVFLPSFPYLFALVTEFIISNRQLYTNISLSIIAIYSFLWKIFAWITISVQLLRLFSLLFLFIHNFHALSSVSCPLFSLSNFIKPIPDFSFFLK